MTKASERESVALAEKLSLLADQLAVASAELFELVAAIHKEYETEGPADDK